MEPDRKAASSTESARRELSKGTLRSRAAEYTGYCRLSRCTR